jgi:hypothetical protein
MFGPAGFYVGIWPMDAEAYRREATRYLICARQMTQPQIELR